MRIFAGTLALIGAVSTLQANANYQDIRRGAFGSMEVVETFDGGSYKEVLKPLKPFHQDYLQQAEFIHEAMNQIKVNNQRENDGTLYTCDGRGVESETDPGYFIPILVGEMKEDGQVIEFSEGLCYQQLTFTYNIDYDDFGSFDGVTLTINAKKPQSMFCRDWFFIANTELFHVETVTSMGTHTIKFTNLDEDAQVDLAFGGLKIYMFCDGYIDTFISALKTILCFVGGLGTDPDLPVMGSHVPEYMEKLNVQFLKDMMGYELVERDIKEYDYDLDLIQSGDFLPIFRLDGLDPIIMYATNSYAGHTTMAMRFDGELYVVESQDGWYWPYHGLQRNKFEEWIKLARNADFHVSHLALKPEARAKFNEKAAQDFFFQTEGLPYGYHNFLFGWLDTPYDNYPPLLPNGLLPIIFSMLDQIIPETIDIFYAQGLNKRLGTVGLNVAGAAAEAARQGMNLEEVAAIPEQDFWEYTGEDPDGWSYVCSAFVTALYKAAGMFDDLEINATEFVPGDIYTMNFFDTEFERPQECAEADPGKMHCQLTGKYRMDFPRYSTIEPYDNLAETCPTKAPEYYRPEFC